MRETMVMEGGVKFRVLEIEDTFVCPRRGELVSGKMRRHYGRTGVGCSPTCCCIGPRPNERAAYRPGRDD